MANNSVSIENVSFENVFNIFLMELKETQVRGILLLFVDFHSREGCPSFHISLIV